MKRLEDLDEEDLAEMTSSGVLTGLKSWLNFGSNVGVNPVGQRPSSINPNSTHICNSLTQIKLETSLGFMNLKQDNNFKIILVN